MVYPREMSERDKDALIQKVLRDYEANPERLRQALPEVAELLDNLPGLTPVTPRSEPQDFDASQLTEGERGFRLASLQAALDKAAGGEALSRGEAVKALENFAALGDDARRLRHAVLDIASAAFEFAMNPEESQSIQILRGKQVHHAHSLIRGITLSLTRDGKLIKMDLDAGELEYRHRALSLMGIGRDKDGATDVAENHDAYLEEIYGERGG